MHVHAFIHTHTPIHPYTYIPTHTETHIAYLHIHRRLSIYRYVDTITHTHWPIYAQYLQAVVCLLASAIRMCKTRSILYYSFLAPINHIN